jgi:hypothetical protein
MAMKKVIITSSQLTSTINENDADSIYLGKHKINEKSWTRKLTRKELLSRRSRT